eukprot:8738366-Pyramimonas_sp.AAC.1
MQKRHEKAVDGSGVSPVEYQQLFAQLGKVMANAKEDAPMDPPPGGPCGAAGSNGGGVEPEPEYDGPKLTQGEQDRRKQRGVPEGASDEQKK